MQGWRKAIIWLVLLWLPVQGFAAGFMPFACHSHAAADMATADAHHHDSHAHHDHAQPPVTDDDGSASHELACDNCALCQMCGALALPADMLKGHPQMSDAVSDSMTPQLQSFIPALPHRPPRALLVA